ncbi:glycosyltransferase family protein [Microlunatus soli]|uniref:Polysaccharide pyruvyl transferase n=1 Tax=Microlunatus soli TaxID=630515 RepID=A0A1H2AN21_9ACTN|nr:hypothetical protein [Microlunatus soli]SDT47333.1 hypothetical protein SAMN04489812_6078 [Microlunatus soli]
MPEQSKSGASTAVSARASDAWITALSNLVAVRSPLSGPLAERLAGRAELTKTQRVRLERLRPWAGRITNPPPARDVPPGEISFGVLGYRAADYVAASRNIGDWVQTLAMMSHLVRRPDVRLTGQADLAKLFTGLQSSVPDDRRIDGPSSTVHLVEFNRDASSYDSLPSDTWAFVFGWYFKLPFGRHPEFPLNPRIIPIFLSFHVSRGDQLSDLAFDYLRAHAPIGCRDWFTVRLLRSRGIPAYFSGCVTTTVGSLFPPVAPDPSKPVAYVDVAAPADDDQTGDAVEVTNLINGLRDKPLAGSLTDAITRLNSYRNDYSRIVTSRLHTLLPSLACGLTVDWQPKDPDDRRFEGLAGPTAEPLGDMAARVSRIAKVALDAILAGKSKSDVYAVYRDEVAADLDATDKHLAADKKVAVSAAAGK